MRILAIIIATGTIATLHSLPIAQAQQESNQERIIEEHARTELAAVRAERDHAAEKKDIERVLSFYAVDFAFRLEGGRKLSRQEIEQVLRLISGADILEQKQRSTIKSIKLRGKEAILEVQDDSFVKQRLQDGSIKETTSSGQKRETWVKTEQGWKLKLIDSAKSKKLQITVNGQKVDPLKAPSDIETPAPNIGDETILQEGHALVFVYRLNDGTIVKAAVYCDDVRLAEMTGGSFIKAKLNPGKYSFHSEKGPAIDINIDGGKIYFFALRLVAGFPKGRGVLEVDTSATGPSAYKLPKLMELRPLGRDNIKDLSRVILEKQ